MLSTTITISVDGEVSLYALAEAVRRWQAIVSNLTDDVSEGAEIEWVVEELAAGSATATVRGESQELEAVDRVVRAYELVGRSLETGVTIPYSPNVTKEARALTALLGGKITSIRFETANESSIVASPTEHQPRRLVEAFGSVEGRIQTLTSRNALRFTLFDSIHDRAVHCYLQEGREELMRDAWDSRAIVEGWVSRDPTSGRPVTVRRVENVILLDDVVAGTYRRARAVAPVDVDLLLPEEVIRQMRDA